MSVEASGRDFTHIPDEILDHPLIASSTCHDGNNDDSCLTQVSSPHFFHHDLHDLESLWWIAVWIFFTFCVSSEQELPERGNKEQELKRRKAFERLFPRTPGVGERGLFLQNQGFFEEMTRWIPSHRFKIRKVLNALRRLLMQKYRDFESRFPAVELHVFHDIHDAFRIVLAKCRELFRGAILTPYVDFKHSDLKQGCPPLCAPKEPVPTLSSSLTCRSDCISKHRATGLVACTRKRKRDEQEDCGSLATTVCAKVPFSGK